MVLHGLVPLVGLSIHLWANCFVDKMLMYWPDQMHLGFYSLATKTVLNVLPHLSAYSTLWCRGGAPQVFKAPQKVVGMDDIFGRLQRFHPSRKKFPSVVFTKLKDFFYLLSTLPESLVTLNFWSPTHPDPCQNYNIKPPWQVLHHWG